MGKVVYSPIQSEISRERTWLERISLISKLSKVPTETTVQPGVAENLLLFEC